MQTISVLIVEDDDADRKWIRRLLSRTEYEVRIKDAVSVEQALDFEEPDVHVVFLDHRLPGASGLDFIAQFRRTWPKAAIFFLTGQGDEELAKSAIKFGATDYAPKSNLNQNAIDRMLKNGLSQALAQWRLDEQRRDLATFTEVLVHDFQAPIRAAAYLAEQIEEDIEDGDMQEAREGLRMLRKSATQMQEMLRSLADHVRLDRDEILSETTARDLIDRALTALDREIAESRAVVDVDSDALDRPIFCHPPQIAQVLQNLVANAIKYRGDNPPRIRLAAQFEEGNRALFTVSDNGIGVPDDQKDRIFEPFKRVSTHNGISGTGLGLATCRKFVSRHGGAIWCADDPDAVTSICFRIPAGSMGTNEQHLN
ncbi:sensor histidine kinase [Tropicibacter sp. S64]|uniref:sensor histidine kinase n=1 Tax=Tropicibacter sp. S64 TaxID=3415122 RepID=UPI003C7DF4DA